MSKIISFKGQIPIGEEERIKLSTLKGKTGYKIVKFQTISRRPGAINSTTVTTVYDKKGGIPAGKDQIDFTDSNLLAISSKVDGAGQSDSQTEVVIFDNSVVNQDIFLTAGNPDGGTQPVNYYIELEAFTLSDIESTKLTLQSIRSISSR